MTANVALPTPSSEAVMGLPSEWAALLALIALWIVIWLWIRSFLANRLEALPEEHRHWRPRTVWLLLVPGVNLVWNFHFLPGLSQAYLDALGERGRELPRREGGRNEAYIYSVVFVVGWYPMNPALLAIVWMAGLLALTVYLFKIHSMAERLARLQRTG